MKPKILVVELWQIGDVVMLQPMLGALRQRFPGAEISLLGKPHARVLLGPTGLVDRFIEVDVPWTAFEGKYRWHRYRDAKILSLIAALRREHFDASIDARMDPRSNVLTWLIGARRRIGFAMPGAAGLLTDALPDPGRYSHKVEDWLALLAPLACEAEVRAPALDIPEDVQLAVDRKLEDVGLDCDTLIGIHASAAQQIRRWPLDRFREVISQLGARAGTKVMVLVDPDGYGARLTDCGAVAVRASLEELPAYLRRCSLFVGNDTGPAHIAAAVGTPTLTIFGPGAANWFRPYGAGHTVVQVDPMPCRPCFDMCTQATNICLQNLSVASVMSAVDSALGQAPLAATECVSRRVRLGSPR